MEVIKISQLNAKYNEHLAIKNINLNINSHEYLCLVGKNGSGNFQFDKNIC